MKLTFLLCILLTTNILSMGQTIRRVNNLPGVAAGANTYTTIQGAIDASTDGDIIYIEPSSTMYDGFTSGKQLTFIGNGNFLTQNPNTPFDKNISWINGIVRFVAGSSGSTLIGLYLNQTTEVENAEGIQFKGNRIGSIHLKWNTPGILIAENYIDGELRCLEGNSNATSGTNATIRNNIIHGIIISFRNSLIFNNTISGVNSYFSVSNNQGCTILNNIIDFRAYSASPIPDYEANNPGSSATNNLQILPLGAIVPPSTTNYFTTDPGSVFETVSPWSLVKDAGFRLKAGSPALSVGPNNIHAGAFGGTSPYKLSTLPNVPIITSAFTSGTGNNTAPLQVKITIRSN